MSQFVDLMPESCRVRQGQRMRLRQWVVLYVTSVAALGASWMALGMVQSRLESAVFLQQAHLQMVSHQRMKASEIRKDVARLLREQIRHDNLVWPVAVGDVVEVVGGLAPERVTLTALTITPRQVRKQPAASAGRGERDQLDMRLAVEIRGVALSDADMANFMAGLETHPLFGMVAIDYSRRTAVLGMDAREFGLASEIELAARYRFASGEQGGGR